MDLSSLEIFCAVAETASITRAAAQVQRVPSNVTTRIQQLEEQLRVALFQREGKRMVLTAEGERFADYARRLLSLAQEATQALHATHPLGLLTIGTMEATAASRLPVPLAMFHASWPDVTLQVSTGTSARLINDVARHQLDCALVALAAGETPQDLDDSLSGVPIWTEQLMLLSPAANTTGNTPGLAAFASGCSYRNAGENWLRKSAPKGVKVIESTSYHAILAIVATGTCAAVIPRSVLALYSGPASHYTATPLQTMDTWLIWRTHYKSAALNEFRRICESHGELSG